MNAPTPPISPECHAAVSTLKDGHVRKRLSQSFVNDEIGLDLACYLDWTPSQASLGMYLDVDHARLRLSVSDGSSRSTWHCARKTACYGTCNHFTGKDVLEQVRKFIWALAAYVDDLPWPLMRKAGAFPISPEDRLRLQRELPEAHLLPAFVFEILGEGLMDLLQVLEDARANDIVLHEKAAARARIKKLFEMLPARTVLIRDDGCALGTITDVPGRTTRRSIDCKPVHGKTVTREDVRLKIRESYRLATPERLRDIPAAALSNHERMKLLAHAAPLKEAFAEIA